MQEWAGKQPPRFLPDLRRFSESLSRKPQGKPPPTAGRDGSARGAEPFGVFSRPVTWNSRAAFFQRVAFRQIISAPIDRQTIRTSERREGSRGARIHAQQAFKTEPAGSHLPAAGCRKTPGELERAGALSNNNRPRRRERRGREDFCGGKFNFPEQKPFLCSFCGRNPKDSSKNWRGWQGG